MSNDNMMKLQQFLDSLDDANGQRRRQVDDELLEFLLQLLDQDQQSPSIFDDQDPDQLCKILEGEFLVALD